MFATQTSNDARAIASALRDADALIARAVDLIGRTDVECETGLSSELFLTLEARCTGSDARFMSKAAATLRRCRSPKLRSIWGSSHGARCERSSPAFVSSRPIIEL